MTEHVATESAKEPANPGVEVKSSKRSSTSSPTKRRPNKVRSRIVQIVGAVFLLLVILLVWRFFGDRSQTALSKPRGEVVPVETAKVTQENVPIQIKSIGNVEALSTVSVRSQIEGTLERVYFAPGQEVKKGDLLFTIDSRPLQAALSQAEANLLKSMASVRQGQDIVLKDQATAKNLRTIAKRDLSLIEAGVISREEYDNAVSAADAADALTRSDQSAVANLQAAVKAEQANVQSAQVQLGYTSIRAPLTGKTGNLAVTAGNLVPANNTTPLVTITQTAPIYVTFSVPEQELQRIRKYASSTSFKTEVIIPGDEANTMQGKLSLVDNTVDMTTGTVRLKATFENPDRRLYPGQFVNTVLTLGTQENAAMVPSQAVQVGQDSSFVYVVKPDTTVEVRKVKTGTTLNDLAVIEEGLQVGELVVTDGQLRLTPGAKVQAKGAGSGAANPGKQSTQHGQGGKPGG